MRLMIRPQAFFPLRTRRVGKYDVMPPPEPNRVEFPYVGRLSYQGLLINLEHLPGDVRKGKDPDGKPWAITMRGFYGEFNDTLGADGDPVDVYVGPDPDAPTAYVVHQKVPGTQVHDEDKVLLGFGTLAEARAFYMAHYDKPGFWGGSTCWPVAELMDHLRAERHTPRLDKPTKCRMVMLGKADRLPGGKADDKDPSDFDPDELDQGTEHEGEHTDDEELAREIAMDHLAEDPDYYDKLEELEKASDLDMATVWRRNDLVDELGDVAVQALASQGMQRLALLDYGFELLHKARKIAHQPGLHFDPRTHRWMRDQRAPKKQGGLFQQPTADDAAKHRPKADPKYVYKPGKFKGHEGDRYSFKEAATGRDDLPGQGDMFDGGKKQESPVRGHAEAVASALGRAHSLLQAWDQRVVGHKAPRHVALEQLHRFEDLFEHALRQVPADDHARVQGVATVRRALRDRQRALVGPMAEVRDKLQGAPGLGRVPSAEDLLQGHPMHKASGVTAGSISSLVPEDLEGSTDPEGDSAVQGGPGHEGPSGPPAPLGLDDGEDELDEELEKCVRARRAVLRALLVGDPTREDCNAITRLVVAGAPSWRAVDHVLSKGKPIKGRPGLHLDPVKHRWVRNSEPAKSEPAKHTVIYNGIFLDDPAALSSWWTDQGYPIPDGARVLCHHMTSYFRPSKDKLLETGVAKTMRVVGVAHSDTVGAVVVEADSPSQNKVKHVTVWVKGVSPAASNALLADGYTSVDGPTLRGVTGEFAPPPRSE